MLIQQKQKLIRSHSMLTNVYHLIKPHPTKGTLNPSSNIFQNSYVNIYQEMKQKIIRPVGGISTFNREKMRRDGKMSLRNLSSANKKQKKSQVEDANKPKQQDDPSQEDVPQLESCYNKQEEYKSNHKFRPSTAVTFKTKSNINSKNSYTKFTNLKVPQKTIHWADQQIEDFNKKSAILGQVVYKQSLVQRYGDRYFQYCLRDRYKQDISPPPYIYQISNKQNKGKSRFRETFQKLRPDIKSRQRLVVKGHQFRCSTPIF